MKDLNSSFPFRMMANLLPLSKSKTCRGLKKEWVNTERSQDLKELIGHCELCGHSPIRYRHEITSQYTDKSLFVGCKCLKKFGVRKSEEVIEQ